jgi:uncharacterized protein (DUF1800 family)
MIGDLKAEAALALHRFGMGPRPGSIAAIASDPRGAVLADLDRPDAGQVAGTDLMPSGQAARAAFDFRAERQARQITEKREAERVRAMAGEGMEPTIAQPAAQPPRPTPELNIEQKIFAAESKARVEAAVSADIGFAERLVWFWSNHFCVSADKVPNLVGGYEREAIRAHLLGRFSDMLFAAETHPAMLVYLDNFTSIGPNSVAGINRSRGLNENLAREILELHTLGVRTGYTQDDVTRFAHVLTGWTLLPIADNPDNGGEFVFNRRLHEPGPQIVVGKSYPDTGADQGRAVLADLARHPATANHVATQFAAHFIADQPPPALVERLTKTFRDSDGDLKQMARDLVAAPEAWAAPRTKLKRPGEWRIASLRAIGAKAPDVPRIVQSLALLGEPLWRPPSPKGFSDEEAAWLDGLSLRLDIANSFADRIGERFDPRNLVETTLGSLASSETRQAVARAESRGQAMALLLMSPEFLRR